LPGHVEGVDRENPYSSVGIFFDELLAYPIGILSDLNYLRSLEVNISNLEAAKVKNPSGFSVDQSWQLNNYKKDLAFAQDELKNGVIFAYQIAKYISLGMEPFVNREFFTLYIRPDNRTREKAFLDYPEIVFVIEVDEKLYEISFPITDTEHIKSLKGYELDDPIPDEILSLGTDRDYLFDISSRMQEIFAKIRDHIENQEWDAAYLLAESAADIAINPPVTIPEVFNPQALKDVE